MSQMGSDMRHAGVIDERAGRFLGIMAALLLVTMLLMPCVIVTSVAVADALLSLGG